MQIVSDINQHLANIELITKFYNEQLPRTAKPNSHRLTLYQSSNHSPLILAIYEQDNIIALLESFLDTNNPSHHRLLSTLIVSPHHRNKGYAKKLFSQATLMSKSTSWIVHYRDSKRSHLEKFYKKLGFTDPHPCGTYGNKETMWEMQTTTTNNTFMNQAAWKIIESFYNLPHINPAIIAQFRHLKSSQTTHTKQEGNLRHYCVFFLPFDKQTNRIYLGHHKKADDWIPPGGHLDIGETPTDAAIREMAEELRVDITPDMLQPYTLSIKEIGRPEAGCEAHYDVWYLVNIPEQQFSYLKKEYHHAAWFSVKEGVAQIEHNPDYATIISHLDVLS